MQTWSWDFGADGSNPVLALEVSAHASLVPDAPPEWFDVSLAVGPIRSERR